MYIIAYQWPYTKITITSVQAVIHCLRRVGLFRKGPEFLRRSIHTLYKDKPREMDAKTLMENRGSFDFLDFEKKIVPPSCRSVCIYSKWPNGSKIKLVA